MGNHTITICVAGEHLHVKVWQSLVNIRYLYIPIIHLTLQLQFLFGFTILPRELENNTYVKFWGVKKVYYG